MDREQTTFEKKVKPILGYIGLIGAIISCIAYVIAVFVLINGFDKRNVLETTTFGVVNAIVGFIVMQFLKVQGEQFAKDLPENKLITDAYNKSKVKKEKNHSMRYYWVTSVIKDIFTKCVGIAITTFGVIYIVIEGSHDYSLLGLAVVNLLMFICFGLLSLIKTYDYYNDVYIPYVLEKGRKE